MPNRPSHGKRAAPDGKASVGRPVITNERQSTGNQLGVSKDQDGRHRSSLLQNTIFDEKWEESYSRDVAVLQSLLL